MGGNLFCNKDGTLCYGAQTYVRRLVDTCKELFGEQPKEVHSPLDKDDKPELDDTPLLGPDSIKRFQTLIGAAHWLITLSHFDIAHMIMSLGHFRATPREGHMECLKRVIGYMQKHLHCAIQFRTGIPNYEEQFGDNPVQYDWMETICGSPQEEIDSNAPPPKGKPVRLSSFFNANSMHGVVTGRSASGIREFINQMPIDWFSNDKVKSKLQPMVPSLW